MSAIIEVRHLCKHYKETRAVDDLSFSIPEGSCFGLLGPNGAGKTTTIEMMEGITKPTSGEILYKGQVDNPAFKLEAGIQFQSTALMDYVTVDEVLRLFASFYPRTIPLPELIELCQLSDFQKRPAARLSGGQRQRVLLALALINDPDILFLDEPTTGLDPQSRRNFWTLIEDVKSRGKTLVLTTHYMDEAEYLCDQLTIVDRGKIIAEGTPTQLLDEHFNEIFVSLDDLETHPALDDLGVITKRHGRLTIATQSVEKALAGLMEKQVSLEGLQVHNPTLDDLFLKLTGHSLRE